MDQENKIIQLVNENIFLQYSDIFDADKSSFTNGKVSLQPNVNYNNTQTHTGIYATWLELNHQYQLNENFQFDLHHKKKIVPINLNLKDYYFRFGQKKYLCIDVGKTGANQNISARFKQRLEGNKKLPVPKTVARIVQLVQKIDDPIKFIIENFKYSFIEEGDIANRFFLENAAIAELRPLFNIEY